MAGLDDVSIAGTSVGFSAVVMHDVHSTGSNHTDVARLAAVAARYRLDTQRPTPAGLGSQPSGLGGSQIHHFQLGLIRGAGLVRRIEALYNQPCHGSSSGTIVAGGYPLPVGLSEEGPRYTKPEATLLSRRSIGGRALRTRPGPHQGPRSP